MNPGTVAFILIPIILAGLLLWRYPGYRRLRARPLFVYVVVMSLLIWGALAFVAHIAGARVVAGEIAVILWFTIGWRLAWTLWSRMIGRRGQRYVRWARWQRRRGHRVPRVIRLIPPARALLTALVFFPLFLSMVVTHRFKLRDGESPARYGLAYESVRIPTEDGLTLDGWFIPEDGSDRTLVICHGAGANKGNFIWFLGPFAQRGYNVVFFDFRAHGASDGRTTTYGLRERLDVRGVVDWLKRERPMQSRTIVGLGSSQGAMALALAAADDPRIDAVILDSPFTSPRELVAYHATRLPGLGPLLGNWLLALASAQTATDFFAPSAERAVAAMGPRPVMVIHGDRDVIMPREHSQRLLEAATGPRKIWFGTGPHSNIVTDDPSGYREQVFEFLDRTLGPAPRPRPGTSRPAGVSVESHRTPDKRSD